MFIRTILFRQPRFLYFILFFLCPCIAVQGQELLQEAEFPVQNFFLNEDGESLDVICKNQLINQTIQTPYRETLIRSSGEEVTLNENEQVVWAGKGRIITLSNTYEGYNAAGMLRLYLLEDGKLNIQRSWAGRGKHAIEFYPVSHDAEVFVAIDSYEGGGSTFVSLLDADLKVLWQSPFYERDIHDVKFNQVGNQLSISYLSFAEGDFSGILYWCLFDLEQGQLIQDIRIHTGQWLVNDRIFLQDLLFVAVSDPEKAIVGFEVINMKGEQVHFQETEVPIQFWLRVKDKLIAQYSRLAFYELDPTNFTFSPVLDLIPEAEKQFPDFGKLDRQIFYYGVKKEVSDQAANIVFTVPIGEATSPLYHKLLTLIYSENWNLKDAFWLEGPSEKYAIQMTSGENVLISFGSKIYSYENE